MEIDIKKSRKISIIREKYTSYCDKVVEELKKNEIKSAIYIMALEKLKDFLKTPVEECSKELCLQSVDKCRKLPITYQLKLLAHETCQTCEKSLGMKTKKPMHLNCVAAISYCKSKSNC